VPLSFSDVGGRAAAAAPWLVIAGCRAVRAHRGGQAYPQDLFPGFTVSSSFADGIVQPYTPSAYELALGIGGIAIAFLIALVGARVLDFLPDEATAAPPGAD
jgi:molybdopterin-containing oxidoreductase family membrane subunit